MPKTPEKELSAKEIEAQEKRVLRHMLTTPHKPHQPLGKTKRLNKGKRTK